MAEHAQPSRRRTGRPARLSRTGVAKALAAAALTSALALGAARADGPLAAPRPETRPADPVARAPASPPGVSGWLAVDLDTGAVLDAHNATRSFVPASVVKLVTALYALDRLGPGHRFVTRLLAAGPVVNGRLEGDLVLAGGGDPELDSDALADLAARLDAAGVRSVAGRFLVDATALPDIPAIAPDQPVDAAYNPGLSGLNLNFNRVRLRWQGGGRGLGLSALAERSDPPVTSVRVETRPGLRAPALALGDAGETWVFPRAALRGRGARWLPVRRPAAYAGDVFARLARARGIELPAPRRGRAPRRAALIAAVEGRPLVPVLRAMLDHSTNLTAEVVGLAASRAGAGRTAPATLLGSAGRMAAWARTAAGLGAEDAGFRLANHSGLTLGSRLRPDRVVRLLRRAARRPAPDGAGHPRLPGPAAALLPDENVAAESEPLDYARLAVLAKSGTMDQIRGLAGYVATPGGRRLAFAIFSNRLAARAPRAGRPQAGWLARARGFERRLIRSWVRRADAPARDGG